MESGPNAGDNNITNPISSTASAISPSLPSSVPSNVPSTGNEEQPPTASNITKVSKHKSTKKASWIWEHFTKVDSENKSESKAKCNYCVSLISCITANGTSGMINHLGRCKIYNCNSLEKRQKTLETIMEQSDKGKGNKTTIVAYSFSQEDCRKALVKMIIIDELPFKYVEREGFHEFCAKMQPRFLIPSRTTVTRDCYELFIEKKKELKSFFAKLSSRVCLTTDTWTSCQNLNYMCLTAHFIDDNWQLHKRVINFCPISSHAGEVLGKVVEKCLLEWGIDKVFTITVDNASSNDLCINYLKKRLNSWKGSVLNGKYFHMRCAAHVMSLTVKEGLKEIDDSIIRIRSAVRYVRSSPARLQRFKACVEKEKIKCNNNVCLDVETRWNSTYLMLDSAIKFQKAFVLLNIQDSKFTDDLNLNKGVPTETDWDYVHGLMPFLKIFYDATTKLSGSLYATSNLYGKEIFGLGMVISKYCISDNSNLRTMASNMLRKHKKYWGNVETLNVMIFIAMVLDPRCKLDYVNWIIDESYGVVEAIILKDKIMDVLSTLFNSYNATTSSLTSTASAQTQISEISSEMEVDHLVCVDYMNMMYKKQKGGQEALEKKTELDKYLKEECEEPTSNSFDILCWWKVNGPQYPVLSLIARDVLAFPVSTVASESAFSTSGRVLDPFRSSLTPRIVEALICAQDWLRRSQTPFFLEEALDELEKLESEMALSSPSQIDIDCD